MADSKIRIKVGSMEIEYEGDPAFLDGGIEKLLVTMADLAGKVPEEPAPPALEDSVQTAAPKSKGGSVPDYSTKSVAAALGAKTCSDLALAALSKIEIVDGAEGATRGEILEEMQTAGGYYKKSFSGGNLSRGLDTLTKSGRLHEMSGNRFALSADEKAKIEGAIANH